jgi:hypothetical protein
MDPRSGDHNPETITQVTDQGAIQGDTMNPGSRNQVITISKIHNPETMV